MRKYRKYLVGYHSSYPQCVYGGETGKGWIEPVTLTEAKRKCFIGRK